MMSSLWTWLSENGQGAFTLSLILLISFLAVYGYYQTYIRKEPFSWEKYGVPHAKVSLTTFVYMRGAFNKLIEQYGDTVGFVDGTVTLLTTDVELIRKILVQDSSNFLNRPDNPGMNTMIKKSVFFLTDQPWKRKRHLLTPNFSTAKLKIITRIVDEKARRLGSYIAECAEKNSLISTKHLSGQFAGEVIAQTSFGCQVDCIGMGEKDEFSSYSQNIFRNRPKYQRILMRPILRYPWIQKVLVQWLKLSFFDSVNPTAFTYFMSLLKEVVTQRLNDMRQGNKLPMDFLQMLLNASVLNEEASNAEERNLLSQEDVMVEIIFIIFAGFETTSTSLQFILYLLAVHQDVQDKVLQEIKNKIQGETPTYDELSQLTSMKQVIDESMRCFSPVPLVDRMAQQDITYGDLTIPAGARVVAPMFLIHQDPKHYKNPDVFDPERFSPEQVSQRHPYAFIPFGSGPRICLGMRLAIIELKLALVYVLRKVNVVLNDRTSPKAGEILEVGPSLSGIPLPTPKTPMMLAVKRRNG